MKMISIQKLIDETINSIWQNEIKNDYDSRWLLKEDTLKASFYFHLRNKLGHIFDLYNIRIFTEFSGADFKGSRPDMVITMRNDRNDTTEYLAVIEFKYKSGFAPVNDIYNDFVKLKSYVNELNISCRLYMVTIWEYQDNSPIHWERKNAAYAKGKLVELNASYNDNYEMIFYPPYVH